MKEYSLQQQQQQQTDYSGLIPSTSFSVSPSPSIHLDSGLSPGPGRNTVFFNSPDYHSLPVSPRLSPAAPGSPSVARAASSAVCSCSPPATSDKLSPRRPLSSSSSSSYCEKCSAFVSSAGEQSLRLSSPYHSPMPPTSQLASPNHLGGRNSSLALPASPLLSSNPHAEPTSPFRRTPSAVSALFAGGSTHSLMHRSSSFQDAQMASVAQLLDVLNDLQRAHSVYEDMEEEHRRHSLRNNLPDNSITAVDDVT